MDKLSSNNIQYIDSLKWLIYTYLFEVVDAYKTLIKSRLIGPRTE